MAFKRLFLEHLLLQFFLVLYWIQYLVGKESISLALGPSVSVFLLISLFFVQYHLSFWIEIRVNQSTTSNPSSTSFFLAFMLVFSKKTLKKILLKLIGVIGAEFLCNAKKLVDRQPVMLKEYRKQIGKIYFYYFYFFLISHVSSRLLWKCFAYCTWCEFHLFSLLFYCDDFAQINYRLFEKWSLHASHLRSTNSLLSFSTQQYITLVSRHFFLRIVQVAIPIFSIFLST